MIRLPWHLPTIVGLIGLSALALTLEHPSSPTVPVIRKTKKTMSAPGEVIIQGRTTIVKTPPQIARTLIKPGDRVEKGQVIFILPSYQTTMAKIQTSLTQNPQPQDWQKLSHQLRSTKVRAPIGGQVIRVEPIVEIADPEDFQVIAHVSSEKVKAGQMAIILGDQIELAGEVTEVQANQAKIRLKEPSLALKLLEQPLKIKFLDEPQLAYYN
jgi:biotin carboxyl carrier protein